MSVSYMPIYVAIIMYGLRLFIVVYIQESHFLPTNEHADIFGVTDFYPFTKFHLITVWFLRYVS